MTNQVLRDIETNIDPLNAAQYNAEEIEKDVFFRTPTRRCGTPTGASGSPTTGTWQFHQVYRDVDLVEWICTVAGTPGTWIRLGGDINIYNDDGTLTGDRAMDGDGNSLVLANIGNAVIADAGFASVASGGGAVVVGGSSNTASGNGSTALGGQSNTASGGNSLVLGGNNNEASGDKSVASGSGAKAVSWAQEARASGYVLAVGDVQNSNYDLFVLSVSDSPYTMFLDGLGGVPIMPEASTWLVEQTIVGVTESCAKTACYIRRYQITRATDEASTTLVGSVQVVGTDTGSNSGAPESDWVISITVDGINGCPKTRVNGGSTDTVKWHSRMVVNQVTYEP